MPRFDKPIYSLQKKYVNSIYMYVDRKLMNSFYDYMWFGWTRINNPVPGCLLSYTYHVILRICNTTPSRLQISKRCQKKIIKTNTKQYVEPSNPLRFLYISIVLVLQVKIIPYVFDYKKK